MNTRNSTHSQILRKLSRPVKGKPLFPADFKGMGSEAAIKMALVRIAKEGKLERIAHGIYVVPKVDDRLGKIYPSAEEIAIAIAQRDRATIKPAGAFALHKLGISTQVPMKLVYITDGTARHIKIGKRGVRFKSTSAKNLAFRGEISSLVIQAFKELGRGKVNHEMIKKVKALLRKEKPALLKEDARLAPNWIGRILFSVLDEKERIAGTF